MRPQLMELTAESRTRSRKRASLNIALHQRLRVVERALDRDRLDVSLARRRHLPALHRRDAAVGKEDGDVDPLAAAKRLDRRAAGIAGGRADDGRALAALGEHMVHEAGEELHRHVLEGERRPVEELEQEMVRPDLDERRDRVVPEGRVGLVEHSSERAARRSRRRRSG